MLFIDTLRGDDATGICFVDTDQSATVFKEAVEACYFLQDGDLAKKFKSCTSHSKALLGHNRKATVGKSTDSTAHPFVYDDRYVFFHNGTLTNHKVFADTEVDSEAFGQAVTVCEGDINKLSEVFAKAQGAWALVWYDSVKHTLYFTRNSQRPLTFIRLDNGDIAYSSEAWIATGPLARNAMKIKELVPLKEHVLYSISLTESHKLVLEEKEIPKKVASTSSKTHGGTHSTGQISKKQAKITVERLESQNYMSFTVDDFVSKNANHHNQYESCDWYVTGYSKYEPGVEFKGIIKDKYEYEMNNLVNTKVWGSFANATYTDGSLLVWISNISEVGTHLTC